MDDFKLLPWQIEDLDRWWIQHVYFHPRDKHGAIVIRKKDPARTFAQKHRKPFKGSQAFQIYWDWAKSWGWRDWMIRSTWPTELAWQNAQKAKSKRRQ